MSSSKALRDGALDRAAPGSRGASSYTRFIPREELADFSAWTPNAIGDPAAAADARFTEFNTPQRRNTDPGYRAPDPHSAAAQQAAADFQPGLGMGDADLDLPQPPAAEPSHTANQEPAAGSGRSASEAWRETVRSEVQQELLGEWQEAAEAELDAQVQAARQTGYQDGYRDGLVALDSFKQSYAQQVTSQVSQLMQAFDQDLQAMEQQLAEGVVRVATELARQVVRSELSVRPALVAQVAQEAVGALLKGARHVSISLHPDDLSLVRDGCGEALQTAGAQLLASAQLARGGCKVESDLGSIDARIATRWQMAARALGSELPWVDDQAEAGADA